MFQWSFQMPDDKKESPKPSKRFVYSKDDVDHIFRLGDIGTVFSKNENVKNSNILLKKLIEIKKKLVK